MSETVKRVQEKVTSGLDDLSNQKATTAEGSVSSSSRFTLRLWLSGWTSSQAGARGGSESRTTRTS